MTDAVLRADDGTGDAGERRNGHDCHDIKHYRRRKRWLG